MRYGGGCMAMQGTDTLYTHTMGHGGLAMGIDPCSYFGMA